MSKSKLHFSENAADVIMSEKETYEASPQGLEGPPRTNTSGSDVTRTSLKTAAEAEAQREHARHGNPRGYTSTDNGINVQDAEAEFAALQRELSGVSRRASRTQSGSRGINEKSDVEKVASSDSSANADVFDLEGTLRGNQSVSSPCVLCN